MMKVGTDGVLLGAWAQWPSCCKRILDIGTGTGLVALMLAQRCGEAAIDAIEIDDSSLLDAQVNAVQSPWKERLHFYLGRIQDYATRSAHLYDLIVSNPPFFKAGVARNSARHTLMLSHEELVDAVVRLLTPKGYFCLILPFQEGRDFIALAKSKGLWLCKTTEVSSTTNKPPHRLLMQFGREQCSCVQNKLHISNNQSYSPDFIGLTKDFYLAM